MNTITKCNTNQDPVQLQSNLDTLLEKYKAADISRILAQRGCERLMSKIQDTMDRLGVTAYTDRTSGMAVAYSHAGTRRTLDIVKLKADHPDLCEQYTRVSDTASKLVIQPYLIGDEQEDAS